MSCSANAFKEIEATTKEKGEQALLETDKSIRSGPLSATMEDFFLLAGIWEERNLSLEKIRYKAWKKHR